MRWSFCSLSVLSLTVLACQGTDPTVDASVDAAVDASPTDAGPDADGIDASTDGGDVRTDGSTPTDAGPTIVCISHAYVEDEAPASGPERGFYRFATITDTTDLSWVADSGYRLVFSYVRLDDYRDADIPSTVVEAAGRGLDAARAAGVKVILRFAYNNSFSEDAPLDRILAHIEQLRPLMAAHADVIAIVQTGFVGAWGEWHSSTNGLTDDPATRRAIVEALLDAVPPELSVQMRLPQYKEEMYGAARTSANAHDGSYGARLGHHNDCFLSSETDVGTYPADNIERVTNYVAADTLFVPMGGETCAPFPARSDCVPALVEFERLHVSYMNEDYHPDIVDAWRDQGCYDELASRMGYRLVVESATFPDSLPAGARATIEVTIRNEGWAAPFNPRALIVRLGDDIAYGELDRDARWLLPGEATVLTATLEVPESATGSHALTLAAPDPHASIAGRPEYALPLANVGYDAALGHLPLGAIMVE